MPIEPSHLSLFVAFLSLVVSIKVAYDVGRIAGQLSDKELARAAVEELRSATREA